MADIEALDAPGRPVELQHIDQRSKAAILVAGRLQMPLQGFPGIALGHGHGLPALVAQAMADLDLVPGDIGKRLLQQIDMIGLQVDEYLLRCRVTRIMLDQEGLENGSRMAWGSSSSLLRRKKGLLPSEVPPRIMNTWMQQ